MHDIRALYKTSRKTWKTLFSHTFSWKVVQKAKKKTTFFSFYANSVQCVTKNVKNIVYSQFSGTLCKKFKKISSCILCELITNSHVKPESVTRNVKKHCYLTLFAKHRTKSSKNAVFLNFFELSTQCHEKREKTVPPLLCSYMIRPTRLWPHDCTHTRLCPDTFVPTNVCAQTHLCSDMIVPWFDCSQTRLNPDTFVTKTHLCPDMIVHTRLSSYMTRHVCAQTCLCPDTIMPWQDMIVPTISDMIVQTWLFPQSCIIIYQVHIVPTSCNW